MIDGRRFNRRYDLFDYYAATIFNKPPSSVNVAEKEQAMKALKQAIEELTSSGQVHSKAQLIRLLKMTVLKEVYKQYPHAAKSQTAFYRLFHKLGIE